MRRKLTWVVLFSAAILVAAIFYERKASATPANSGFKATTIATGTFGDIDVFNQSSKNDLPAGFPGDVWLSLQKTKGLSDLYVQNNVWQPGGTSGWHTHPGRSLITVIEGTVTAYEGDDPDCKPTVYTKGMGFVDPGHGHVHNLRNEGGVEARTITVQLLPAGAPPRIDAENPGHSSF